MFRRINKFLSLVLVGLTCGGCRNDMPQTTGPVAPNVERFIYVPRSWSENTKQEFRSEWTSLIGERANSGDVIHVIWDGKPLASLVIPDAMNKNARLRTLSGELTKINPLFEAPPGRDDQLDFGNIALTLRSIRSTDHNAKVILVGNPIYEDPKNPDISMDSGRVFSDGFVTTPGNVLYAEADAFPEGTTVDWWTLNSQWSDADHRKQGTRFWRLYFQEQSATLTRFTSKGQLAFNNTSPQFEGEVMPTGDTIGLLNTAGIVVLTDGNDGPLKTEIDVLNRPPPDPHKATIVFLYDCSGSAKPGIAAIKEIARQIEPAWADTPTKFHVGAVRYGQNADQIDVWPIRRIYRSADDGGESLKGFMDYANRQVASGGGANIQGALTKAMAMHDEHRDGSRALILVIGDVSTGEVPTDKPGDDELLLEQVRRWANVEGEDRRVVSVFYGHTPKAQLFFEGLGTVSEKSQVTGGDIATVVDVLKDALEP